jgi:hypothetical protein
MIHVFVFFPLVPKLRLGNGLMGTEAGAWEQEAKDLHPADSFTLSFQKIRTLSDAVMFVVRIS